MISWRSFHGADGSGRFRIAESKRAVNLQRRDDTGAVNIDKWAFAFE